MSKLEQLIHELCPNGVEWRTISDIGRRNKGMPITAAFMKKIENKDGDIQVFAAGNNNIMAFRKDLPGDNLIEGPAILVKSRGNIGFEFVNRTFTHKNELWSYTIKGSVNSKYVFYYLSNHIQDFQNTAKANSVKLPQLCVADTDNYKIPIPPLPVQEEIVRILDAFTDYTAELQAELQARREQYEYYRNKLLSFEDDSSVEWKKLGEICEFINGRAYKQDELLSEGKYKVLRVGNFFTNDKWYYSDLELEDKKYCYSGDLLYAWSASFGPSIWNGPKTIFHYHIWKILCKEEFIDQKYLYHWLKSDKMLAQLSDTTHGATMSHLTKATMEQLQIVLPPLSEQKRIVAILDKFEALVNDLTEGLPAEIAARQEQYEYYRDKLLSFPKAI